MKQKNKLFIFLIIITSIVFTVILSYANTERFNPNKIEFNDSDSKEFVARVINDLNKIQKVQNEKIIKSNEIEAKQVYKLYVTDWEKIKSGVFTKNTDLDSILVDIKNDISVYLTNDGISGACVWYSKDDILTESKHVSQAYTSNEASKLNDIYEKMLKNKKIIDIKVIIHPSHDSNKLIYVREVNDEYVIPVLVDGKDDEVGLKSFHKYSPDEIVDNIVSYINNIK